ncbi:hypothetical protein LZ31DRAFT_373394 [Colletotrichum somersetense]|nr:hypothetical protein LZ31DRAFT_373394 [Colletotrichum somersetense]
MNRYVEALAFVPLAADTHDTVAICVEDSSRSQPPFETRRQGSDVLYPEALPSPLRPALRIGCTSPRGSMNTSMKQKHGWSAFTTPNSLEHLYTEKAYLTASLENQGNREADLMRKLSVLQERIDNGLPSDERRKSRKRAALLKSRIAEVAGQKKAILLRLGDIYVELQSRETWTQIQSELHERRCSSWGTKDVTTPSDVTSMIPTPLDAASPMFFPASYHPLHVTWDVPSQSESQMHALPDGVQAEFRPGCNNAFDTCANELRSHSLRFKYENQALAPGVDEERNQDPSQDDNLRSHRRRMSLPALKCLWPGSEESRGL